MRWTFGLIINFFYVLTLFGSGFLDETSISKEVNSIYILTCAPEMDTSIDGEKWNTPNLYEEDKNRAYIISKAYEIGSIELPNGAIGFINGIDTSEEEAKKFALRLSEYAQGTKVYGVYNATHSIPVDILECIAGQCGIDSPPVTLLQSQWIHFASTHEPDAKFLQICHSGGAIHVFNGLASSSKNLRKKIIVLAISPGKIIPNKLCYESHNYASDQDFVPQLDILGRMYYNDQLIVLSADPDGEELDHGFESPTFQKYIQEIIINYIAQCREQI